MPNKYGKPSRILDRPSSHTIGKPTSLTPEVKDIIIQALRSGAYIQLACQAAGINPTTFYNWLNAGHQGREPYLSFLNDLKAIQAETRVELLSRIKEVGMDKDAKLWTAAAWILERTDPEHFGRLDRRQIDLSGSARINIVKEVISESDSPAYADLPAQSYTQAGATAGGDEPEIEGEVVPMLEEPGTT